MFLLSLIQAILGLFLYRLTLLIKIFDDIFPGNDSYKTLLIVQNRYKVLVQGLSDQILHICVRLDRTVVTPAADCGHWYPLCPFQIQIELVLNPP